MDVSLLCWKKINGPRQHNFEQVKTLERIGVFKASDKQGIQIGMPAKWHGKWIAEFDNAPDKRFKSETDAMTYVHWYMSQNDIC